MIKYALMLAVVGAGFMLGVHESPNSSVAFMNSAQAAVPVPGVFALLGIGGLAMAFGLNRKK